MGGGALGSRCSWSLFLSTLGHEHASHRDAHRAGVDGPAEANLGDLGHPEPAVLRNRDDPLVGVDVGGDEAVLWLVVRPRRVGTGRDLTAWGHEDEVRAQLLPRGG